MKVDIAPALARNARPGVPESELESLEETVMAAHDRIEAGRRNNDHGYAALNLPEQTDPDEIDGAIEGFEDVSVVLVAGIGGSALGAATLAAACETTADLYTMDNVDPAATASLLDSIPLDETVLVGVSRSGTTAETLANFLVAREAIADAGIDWTDRTLVITGDNGPLSDMAAENSLPRLPQPAGVPGRFSALSAVGLAPAALAGVDIEAVLAGGGDAAETLTGSLFECPAYAYGATAYALADAGATVSAMMPYAEGLESFAEWYAQLWAESLGKDETGQVPARALGVTDQHSQLQLYRAGPRNTVVTTVTPDSRPEQPIPEPAHDELSYLADAGLEDLIAAEHEATVGSLTAAERPAIPIRIDAVDAHSVGELLYSMEAACILAGELFGVDTFTQPAVEWGKRATRALLRGDETAETAVIRERESLLVE